MTESATEAMTENAAEAVTGSTAEAVAENATEATAENATEAWPEPPLAGAEAAAVLGALERQRATLAWKCSGLDAAGLNTTLGASAVTLGGLLKHLAHVEDSHFARLWRSTPATSATPISSGSRSTA